MANFSLLLRALSAFVLAATTACSSSSGDTHAASAADGGSPGDGGGFNHDLVFTMTLTVPANTELHQCQFVQLPTGADVNVNGFAHRYTEGSHHFLLYQTTLTAIPANMTGQYDCTLGNEPIMQNATGIVYGAQTPTGAYQFPPGVAATLPAGGVLIMNTHYLNPATKDIVSTVELGLDTTTPDKVQTQGGFFIFYDPFIDVPAHATASSGGRCPVTADVTVLTAFTHYHKRGTDMKVWLDPSATSKGATPFFTTDDWQHPAEFVGPMTWPASSEVRFQCDYDNTDPTEVFQGPNAQTSEMCVLAGLYYPKQPDAFSNCHDYAVTGFGTKACLATATCLQSCPASDAPVHTPTGAQVGPCWEHCVAAACDGAMDAVFPLFGCVSQQCATECAGGSSACLSCTSSKCGAQLSACSAQTCP